jgi:cytochrome c oxidase assembly protein subunit 11
MRHNTRVTPRKLFIFAACMFGFGYALVPVYDVLCDVTGLNGKTGEVSQLEAEAKNVDAERLVTVEFDTNVNPGLPWKFEAAKFKMNVHPGEIAEAIFVVENISDKSVLGQAIPSVVPPLASLYFDKTECFCFTTQLLKAGERKEMVVRYVIGPELPEDISIMTLSYTFFRSLDDSDVAVSETKSIEAIKTKS